MRVKDDTLHFSPKIPKQWKGYSFKIKFRNQILKVAINHKETSFTILGDKELEIVVNGKTLVVTTENLVSVN
ncbi:glycosyl hydrolase family 65 protein [Flavobacterium franklandianum]|nr:glycosyl hydrolase family 65 protein [Flavobacterium franklandianum]